MKINFLSFWFWWSKQLTILHMSRQPSCRDICKSLSWSDLYCSINGNMDFNKIWIMSSKNFVRWVPVTSVALLGASLNWNHQGKFTLIRLLEILHAVVIQLEVYLSVLVLLSQQRLPKMALTLSSTSNYIHGMELSQCGRVMPYDITYPGACLNIKTSSYQYRNSHHKVKTVSWLL